MLVAFRREAYQLRVPVGGDFYLPNAGEFSLPFPGLRLSVVNG
jgi:hypothetical protein